MNVQGFTGRKQSSVCMLSLKDLFLSREYNVLPFGCNSVQLSANSNDIYLGQKRRRITNF